MQSFKFPNKLVTNPVLFIKQLLRRSGVPSIEHILKLLGHYQQEVFFVQVGANEGKTEDPIYPFVILKNWKGIFVEPQPQAFEQLRTNYKNINGLAFERVALSVKEEKRPLYFIDNNNGDLPEWVSKLSSFNQSITAEVQQIYPEAQLASMEVDCITFSHLVEKHQLNHIDLVYIDTEGFDYEIIKTIDFHRITPNLLVFEHRHLSQNDYRDCLALLRQFNYQIYKDAYDTVGILHKDISSDYHTHLHKS